MKKQTLFSLIAIASILLFNACGSGSSSPSEVTITTIDRSEKPVKEVLAENKAMVKMEVEGMTCAMGCAKFIENKVAELDGIVLSKVNFEEGQATFEYDKTSTSPKAIEKFINGIHDGQYKATIAVNEAPEEELKGNNNKGEEKLGAVSERIDNISLPRVFTFLLKRLR